MAKSEDGYATVNGLRLYYRRFGKGNTYKLLTLHGGPGGTHDYLLPLADLADRNFDVVFYDQFGCGKSDDPAKEEDYSLEYAVKEVEGMRKAMFGDEKVHLFGSSWGGMLALAYTLDFQERLSSVTTSSGLASVEETVKEMKRLISLLPGKERSAIEKHEADGDYASKEYQDAANYFMRRHLLRWSEWPDEVMRTMKGTEKRGTYLKMNGPSEFTIIGTIKDVDFKDRLHEIKIPALITCGKFDEVTPDIARGINERIGGSKLIVYQDSAHMQFWEEKDKYLEDLSDFIKKTN